MSTKYPKHVSKLFQPGPPLQYKKPVDYPIESRKTISNIQGISGYLDQLKDYTSEYSQGSENRHLEVYDEADQKRQISNQRLQTKLLQWKPHEDANLADSDPYRTIFVGRLPYSVMEVELQKQFIRFGEIEKVRVVRDKVTNKSRGYGFIMFKEELSARAACREIGVHRGVDIEGRPVIVDIERGRTVKYFTPRRLGGGLGGRGYMKRDRMAKLASPSAPRDTGDLRDEPRKTFPRNPTPRSRFSGYNSTAGNATNINAAAPAPEERTTSYRSRSARTSRFNPSYKPDY
ncbi:LANO_0B06854g1_1 [Lachancea nothofagi CBS 11611]|uniref:LANO_0B06854g1_1 n=1 Tax=Lachancea nothofagi CBS 11611 TaxID=1266666 RepID=A0A1G4IZG2_9SACH|nr:LANO_0B06854g1_1 [Lachancea nothofagi CBS 11611]